MDGLLWEQSDEDNLFIPFHFLMSFVALFLYYSGAVKSERANVFAFAYCPFFSICITLHLG